MIVRETKSGFVMTTQHEHACFSGDIAAHFKAELWIDPRLAEAVLLAIREHDRGWIGLDETPVWNDRVRAPYSFMDYPLYPKLPMYTRGINEVEDRNVYAALICSLHYSSFKAIRASSHPDSKAYIQHEEARQRRIMQQLRLDPASAMIARHLHLLQLCDEISLYVCLNEAGASKEEEHPWYRDGFGTRLSDQALSAAWISAMEIRMEPFPFAEAFTVSLKSKHVSKEAQERLGIAQACKETKTIEQTVRFVP